jgi:hypothetical protein
LRYGIETKPAGAGAGGTEFLSYDNMNSSKHTLHRLWRTSKQEGGPELEFEKLDFVDFLVHWA